MTVADAQTAPLVLPVSTGHEGSASPVLSGRAVVGAWIVSIACHAAVFFTMLALVFPFGRAREEPDLRNTRVELVGPLEPPQLAAGPSQVSTEQPQPSLSPQSSPSEDIRIPPREFLPLSELKGPGGLGLLGGEIGSGGPGDGTGSGIPIIGIGSGGGGLGGDSSGYGLGGGLGPGPEFFGLGGSAPGAGKIVFVVDRSGSMTDTFVYVQKELKRSISKLRRSQKFHVIFFDGGPLLENPPERLVSAIDAHKEQFYEFLDKVFPHGGTRPEGAMRRALSLEPDLVYLLSDGVDFLQNQPGLLSRLDEWNKDRHARICTIAYLDESASKVLEQIAREHDGEFRFVSENDLP